MSVTFYENINIPLFQRMRLSMAFFETSFGIDFRQDHLVLTLLRKSLGKIRLAGYGIYPLSSQILREDREAQMISLINAFMSKYQVDKENVSIAIPRENVVARFISLPIATKENLRKVLEYETPKYTPFEKGDDLLRPLYSKGGKGVDPSVYHFCEEGRRRPLFVIIKKDWDSTDFNPNPIHRSP